MIGAEEVMGAAEGPSLTGDHLLTAAWTRGAQMASWTKLRILNECNEEGDHLEGDLTEQAGRAAR